MEPWQSWTAALVIGAGAFYYYRQPSATKGRAGKPQTSEPSKSSNNRRNNEKSPKAASASIEPERSPTPSRDAKPAKRKKPRKETPVDSNGPSDLRSGPSDTLEPDNEDAEWAKELDAAKRGVNMVPSVAGDSNASTGSAPRKGLGAPADSSTTVASGNDVSDMLEAPASGPSVVRVTGEEKPKEVKPRKASPAKETKKQRQNKKKAEEKKATLDEQEKERQGLLENQRRTAREARGEPAKNGPTPSKAQPNAWSQSAHNEDANALPNGQIKQAEKSSAPLLDTFDRDTPSTSSVEQPIPAAANVRKIPDIQQDLPSEEEQMEAIQQMNGWNEVTTKKGKKKTGPPSTPPVEPGLKENTKETDYATTSTSDLVSGPVQGPSLAYVSSKTKASQPNTASRDAKTSSTNTYAALEAATSFASSEKAHPADSDWAVE